MAVPKKERIQDSAEKAVKTALSKGAAEAEAYVHEWQAVSVGIEHGQITKSRTIFDRGLGIRVAADRAIGFAFTNNLSEKRGVEKAIENALSAAKASKSDPNWNGLPEKKSASVPKKTFDDRIVELRPEELVETAAIMLDAATNIDERVFPVEGGTGAGYVAQAIANSNGVTGFNKGTIIECSLAAVANDRNKVTPVCYEVATERTYNINAEWVGKEAAHLALSALRSKRVETKTTSVVLTQFALQGLLYYTLINAIKADNVQRGQSAFKDKIGMEVASENVTIYDDGLFPGGLQTAAFDGEGVPHQKSLLVENGILKNLLYDNYSAKKESRESTGNGVRGGYMSTPSIEATNFHVIPGCPSSEELIGEVDEGLIIYYLQGAHSSNPVSGEFSVVATPAWKIEKGEIIHSSRGVMLAGNIFEVLKNVGAIASNERKMGRLVAPWMMVENVKVIGK